jgi:hypothetical protein
MKLADAANGIQISPAGARSNGLLLSPTIPLVPCTSSWAKRRTMQTGQPTAKPKIVPATIAGAEELFDELACGELELGVEPELVVAGSASAAVWHRQSAETIAALWRSQIDFFFIGPRYLL